MKVQATHLHAHRCGRMDKWVIHTSIRYNHIFRKLLDHIYNASPCKYTHGETQAITRVRICAFVHASIIQRINAYRIFLPVHPYA